VASTTVGFGRLPPWLIPTHGLGFCKLCLRPRERPFEFTDLLRPFSTHRTNWTSTRRSSGSRKPRKQQLLLMVGSSQQHPRLRRIGVATAYSPRASCWTTAEERWASRGCWKANPVQLSASLSTLTQIWTEVPRTTLDGYARPVSTTCDWRREVCGLAGMPGPLFLQLAMVQPTADTRYPGSCHREVTIRPRCRLNGAGAPTMRSEVEYCAAV
jgi:hypothetical protein